MQRILKELEQRSRPDIHAAGTGDCDSATPTSLPLMLLPVWTIQGHDF